MNIEETIQTLKDAGGSKDFIDKVLSAQKNGNSNQQFVLLASRRQELLNALHKYQKYIDCLDYYIYDLKKTQNTGG